MGRISSFVLGGAIGAAVALAFAPKTGDETRALVVEKANALAGEAKDFGAGFPGTAQDAYKSALERGESLLKGAQDKTSDLVSGAQAKVQDVASGADQENQDELREKIEAARQRIAAQVMENAEQAKEAAPAVTEVPAEAEQSEDAKHAR